jgi:hypothetical protein
VAAAATAAIDQYMALLLKWKAVCFPRQSQCSVVVRVALGFTADIRRAVTVFLAGLMNLDLVPVLVSVLDRAARALV